MPSTYMTGCTATPVEDRGGEPETELETDPETGPRDARRLMIMIKIDCVIRGIVWL